MGWEGWDGMGWRYWDWGRSVGWAGWIGIGSGRVLDTDS